MGFPAELKLKKHETFSIREGWLEKALHYINENPRCLSKDQGTRVFGLGSNMVKSLRYWLKAAGIATYERNDVKLTELGEQLLKYDPYLDDDFSLWMIHIHLVMNYNEAPVFNRFFNNEDKRYEKAYLVKLLEEEFERHSLPVKALSSLDSDVSVLFKSYYSDDSSSPENNMNCPLARLELLSANKGTYTKLNPSYASLDCRVVYQALVLYWKNTHHEGKVSLNIEDMLKDEDNPARMLNITRSTLFVYLDELNRLGYINLAKTAGLNTVYIDKVKGLNELFKSHFEEGR